MKNIYYFCGVKDAGKFHFFCKGRYNKIITQ